jgi:hypothetical protein
MNTRYALLVCQQPFQTQTESALISGGPTNTFCKLAPLMKVSGEKTRSDDFRNDGEVWWMLINQTRPFAKSGVLVTADLEDAPNANKASPTDSLIQAVRESVKKLSAETGYSLLFLNDFSGTKLEHIIDKSTRSLITYQPTDRAFVRCLGKVVGPFKVEALEHPQGWQVSFQTANTDRTVFCIPEADFARIVGQSNVVSFEENISPSNSHRSEAYTLRKVKIELLLTAGYNKLLEARSDILMLESIAEKMARIASQLGAPRAKKQQLRNLLEELDLNRAQGDSRQDYENVIAEVLQNLEAHEVSLTEMTSAFLKSGLFGDDRIQKAEERFAQQYVESRKATLDSEIQAQISQLQRNKQELEMSVQRLKQDELDQKKRAQEVAAKTLKEERAKLEKELLEREQKIESELTALQSLQQTIHGSLAEVTAEMKENGDAIVTRFLSIVPLLGLLPGAGNQAPSESGKSSPVGSPQGIGSPFEFPAYLSASSSKRLEGEQEFITRFEGLVQESGLSYRQGDLRRFHISAKTGSLVVLGGPSGTGKSTLPQLYGRALLGDAFDETTGSMDCLMISVSPGWMDSKDIMGYVNSIDKRFHPSEGGLYLELLKAEYERQNKDDAAPVRLICLDEMNLAQTEHYFGDLLTVLEREGMQRRVRVFSEEACGSSCPFRLHGSIKLSPALRFVGTVNFDETTRLLSDRLLDRTNLIELQSSNLPSLAGWNPRARAEGAPVTVGDYANWTSQDALPAKLAGILDTLRPNLAALGCGISPRTYRGLCAFVASCKGIMGEGEAFDLQMAQRVLSRLRHVHTRAQMDALDAIAKVAEESAESQFEETLRLLEIRRASAMTREWDIE